MAFGALFPATTGSVTPFNAPGFISNPANNAFLTTLAGHGAMVPLPGDAKITNVIADEARQEGMSASTP